MKQIARLASVLVGTILPGAILAAESDGLTKFFENYARGFESSDVKTMESFYEPSGPVHVVVSSGMVFEGKAGVRRMFQFAFEEGDYENVKLTKLKIHEKGDAAWATCRFQGDVALKPDRDRYRIRSQGIFVLTRTKGTWKIVSEHFSPIPGVPRVTPLENKESPARSIEKGIPTNVRDR